MLEFIGRFHPLVIHLPIGILVMAYILEVYQIFKKDPQKQTQSFILLLAAISATISVITGLLLIRGGDYSGSLVFNHKWLAIGLGAICWALFFLSLSRSRRAYLTTMLSSAIMLGFTGHLGGSLTHGEGFLLESNEIEVRPNIDEAFLYADVIYPIFNDKCVSCHNPSKLKGDLNMENHKTLMKGGKNGAILVSGEALNSELIKRANLPLEEDDHMPPSGKKQLNDEELSLITWWIESGADQDVKLVETAGFEDYKDVVSKFLAPPETSVFDRVEKPDSLALLRLRKKDYKLYPISEGSSAVYVNFLNEGNISKKDLRSLRKIKNNVAHLNLSGSGITDGLISELKRFKHLEKLELQNTDITSEGIAMLKELKFLKTLNLFNTKVDSSAIPKILSFPQLRNLYVWKTALNSDQVQAMRLMKPRLNIVYEMNQKIFTNAKLKAPLITAKADIFEDSLEVSLDLNFTGVKVYYTVDGSKPDSLSAIYDKTFKIGKTSIVKAFASKDSWEESLISERSFVKSGKTIVEIRLHNQPQEKYKSFAEASLINKKLGSLAFSDGEWIGYEGSHARATLRLEKMSGIQSVTVGVLEAAPSYIFFPASISVSVSEEGKKFEEVAKIEMPIAEGPNETVRKNIILDFEERQARWVKIDVISHLKNPPWHAAPGAKNWIFIDEFLVN